MVDGSGLENRRARKGTGGSNPSLSANSFETRVFHSARENSLGVRQILKAFTTKDTKFHEGNPRTRVIVCHSRFGFNGSGVTLPVPFFSRSPIGITPLRHLHGDY